MPKSFRGSGKFFGGYSYYFDRRPNPILTTKARSTRRLRIFKLLNFVPFVCFVVKSIFFFFIVNTGVCHTPLSDLFFAPFALFAANSLFFFGCGLAALAKQARVAEIGTTPGVFLTLRNGAQSIVS
jgi:hypothetical protein